MTTFPDLRCDFVPQTDSTIRCDRYNVATGELANLNFTTYRFDGIWPAVAYLCKESRDSWIAALDKLGWPHQNGVKV